MGLTLFLPFIHRTFPSFLCPILCFEFALLNYKLFETGLRLLQSRYLLHFEVLELLFRKLGSFRLVNEYRQFFRKELLMI